MNEQQLKLRLPEPSGWPNRTQFVLGSTGSGKTSLIHNLLLDFKRWIVFDIKSEYQPEFFVNGSKNLDRVLVVHTTGELINALNLPCFKIIFRLDTTLDPETLLNYSLFKLLDFQTLNSHKFGTITVCIDELNRFVDTQSKPIPSLREIVQRGRSRGIEKIFGAQWFNGVPTWVRDSFTELWVFRHNDPNGVRMLSAYGISDEEVMELPNFTTLHYGGKGNEGLVSRVKLTV